MKKLSLTLEETNELRRTHRLTKNKRAADRIKAVYYREEKQHAK